jgi:DNA mismatch repair protein MutS
LDNLETPKNQIVQSKKAKPAALPKETFQIDFESMEKDSLLKEISNYDVMNMTPMEAMNTLYKVIKSAKDLS